MSLSFIYSNDDKVKFYKSLVTKNFTEAAVQAGLDKHYKTADSLRSVAYKIFKTIDPNALGISQDIQDLVKDAIARRKIFKGTKESEGLSQGKQAEILDPSDTKGLVIGGANKAVMLLHEKMNRLGRNKKLLDSVSISQLATTFGILFDKQQILRGEATENIAVMAHVKNDMTAEESLDALLRMREIQQEEKHG
jgi:hypothetical protein